MKRTLGSIIVLLVCAVHATIAQPLDSLLAAASAPGKDNAHRVRIWHELLRDRYITSQELQAVPEVQRILRDTANDNGWAWFLNGSLHERAGAYDRAIDQYREAMASFGKDGDEAAHALANMSLAAIRSIRGDQTAAMRGLYEALGVLERTGPAADEARALLNLAFIFRYQEDYPKALELYRRVGIIGQATRVPILKVEALRGEGGILLEQEHLDEAEGLYADALSICEHIGDERRIAILHVELANVRRKKGDLKGARSGFGEAFRRFEQWENTVWMSYTLARLSEVAHRMGDHQQALAFGRRGHAIAVEKGLMKEALDNLAVLPEVSAALGRYEEALDLSLAYEALHDSMRNDATSTELARLELQQEQVRDSLQRAEDRAREQLVFDANVASARTQRNIYLFIGLGVLMVAVGLWARLRHTRRLGGELAAGNVLIEQEVARAQRSEKVKEQFLANMSHEIRTPMNAIMGMTAILRRNERLPEQERYLDAIAQSSTNLLVILNDVLDLGKLEAGTVELEQVAMDPRAVPGNVLDILRFKAEEKGLKLGMDVGAEVPQHVVGDPTRLNQILLNLVGNAIKFTEKGSVSVQVSVADRTEHGTGHDPSIVRLCYTVRDTGIGIRKERINEIFEEFTQAYSDTTRKYGGTGLGLTITKRLIELQGGTVRVESVPEQGSTFIVEIPYSTAPSERTMLDQAKAPAHKALEGVRILLAEDNEFNVMVARDELEDAIPGVRIDVAPNGRVALEMATSAGYDVILMDIQMPEMNGFEATEAIRELAGDAGRVPIIAMTANVLKSEVDRSMAVGMNAFVPKPFDRQDLLDKLAAAIHQRNHGA